MKHFRSNHSLAVLMMLSLVVTLNGSQAIVLCVGSDGHVAIEPAGHDHCADGSHVCASDADVHDTRLAPGADATRCGGCTDFSMAGEIGSDPKASASSKVIFAGLLIALPAQQSLLGDATCAGLSASESHVFYHLPLRDIVLQM